MAGRDYQPHNSYSGNLARKRQRRFFAKLTIFLVAGLISVAGLIYLFFFAPYLKITEKNINGLKSVEAGEVLSIVDLEVNKNILSFLGLKFLNNIVLFDSKFLKDKILAQLPVIRGVEIVKEYPHKISINITERTALGTWCLDRGCYYFDEDGVLWGKALRSSGSLLLNVEDLRPAEGRVKIDIQMLAGIKELVSGLENIGVKVNRIEIPADSIGEFRVYTTRGYYLILNIESNIKDQINVFRILLKEKGEGFNPQYIDLKVEGRAYFK